MYQTVVINDVTIEVENLHYELVPAKMNDKKLQKLSFNFQVKSSDYHAITTLLYKNDFIVCVPHEGIEFEATISSYFTTITNLYEENAVGGFTLELLERE